MSRGPSRAAGRRGNGRSEPRRPRPGGGAAPAPPPRPGDRAAAAPAAPAAPSRRPRAACTFREPGSRRAGPQPDRLTWAARPAGPRREVGVGAGPWAGVGGPAQGPCLGPAGRCAARSQVPRVLSAGPAGCLPGAGPVSGRQGCSRRKAKNLTKHLDSPCAPPRVRPEHQLPVFARPFVGWGVSLLSGCKPGQSSRCRSAPAGPGYLRIQSCPLWSWEG